MERFRSFENSRFKMEMEHLPDRDVVPPNVGGVPLNRAKIFMYTNDKIHSASLANPETRIMQYDETLKEFIVPDKNPTFQQNEAV